MFRFAPVLALGALALGPAAFAQEGPSFDCKGAESAAEKLVCADADLARLDQRLSERYGAAIEALKPAADAKAATDTLRATQRGWVKGRDECWKAEDLRACVEESYARREGELVAHYMLEEPESVTFWTCNGNPADEVVAYFYATERPSVRLERGDTIDAGILVPAGSGARYEGSVGRSLWVKGEEAILEWPEGETHDCVLRERR